MDAAQLSEAAAVGADLDFSMTALFLRATFTVQLVMVALLGASVWSWAIGVRKFLAFRRMAAEGDAFDKTFWSGQALDELHERIGDRPQTAHERVFIAGMGEWKKSRTQDGRVLDGTDVRLEQCMNVAIEREAEELEDSIGVLATIGAIAPFVGLFGTVWGIKGSFESIAVMQNTNLAVVAPGIAEALLATAMGLVAAIPAVILYNRLSGQAARFTSRLDLFSSEFRIILQRRISQARA